MDETGATSPKTAARYEPLDVPPFLPFWLALLLGSFVGGILLAITLGFSAANHQQTRGPLKPLPPAPQLQLAPHSDLQRYEAAKRQELKGSGASNGTTLPIQDAMRKTATQGWGPPR